MDIFTPYFAQQGVLGIIILILIGVTIFQQRRLDAKDKQITDLQDKRIIDTNSYTAFYANTVKEVVSATKDNLNALTLLQKSVDSLASAFQALMKR